MKPVIMPDGEQLSFELDTATTERPQRLGEHGQVGRRGPSGQELSAQRIATLLGRNLPTPDQVAMIEAPAEPLLVIAGAGSGKTETMAARVVWLVANGRCRPEEILGLTFTRKAAAELGDRVRARLNALRRTGWQDPFEESAAEGGGTATVSTYHAYAASLVTDHGIHLGLDLGARLLGEAGAWQLVDEIVESWDGPMGAVESARSTVIEAVLGLAGECAEHLVTPEQVEAYVTDLIERASSLPTKIGDAAPGKPVAEVTKALNRLAARGELLQIVRAYLDRKRSSDLLDFGDQVAMAAQLARDIPAIGAAERARFRFVLLDEYQDTSYAQLALLRSLFPVGHAVTAVGDPHQSIYGWRGASAGNLQRFPVDFARADGSPAQVRQLPVSWRNDLAILSAANRIAAPLRRPAAWIEPSAAVDVAPLVPRPDAHPGQVRIGWFATTEDESVAVADFAESAWREGRSAAVLCRTRSQFPVLEAALRVRGIPVEVVGLGGLLHVPEVADLRAALEVLHDPTRGDSVMRLLTGAWLRLGPADIDALGAWSRHLSHELEIASPDGGRRRPRYATAADAAEEPSLAEAIERLPEPDWRGPHGEQLSRVGLSRLARLSSVLARLRSRTHLALPELVAECERALGLDVEVAAVAGRSPAAARANLDAFADVAAAFADTAGTGSAQRSQPSAGRATLGSFLAWLEVAENVERGLPAAEIPVGRLTTSAVQLLTVHAAKGLEWDDVAIPGMYEGCFPSGSRAGSQPGPTGAWTLEPAQIPYPLRGDARELPRWRWENAVTQKQLGVALADFRQDAGAHGVDEERRLAYVAVTRARRRVQLSGAVWGDGARPRVPSRFLTELVELQAQSQAGEVVRIGWADEPEKNETNPRAERERSIDWPLDPLGSRRDVVDEAAARVLAAMVRAGAELPEGEVPEDAPTSDSSRRNSTEPDPWADELALLLTERASLRRRNAVVELPGHLSASQVVSLARAPHTFATQLRRPMPSPPNLHTQRGSAFHAWLEQRFSMTALVEPEDLPGAADDLGNTALESTEATGVDLATLQQSFLASEWADRVPDAVEVSVETPVGEVMLRGRIDAVFRRADGGWDVVDWKSGALPRTAADRRAVAVQLAVYRLAWADLAGVTVDQVSAAFFYAGSGQTHRPVDLLDAEGLNAAISAAVALTQD